MVPAKRGCVRHWRSLVPTEASVTKPKAGPATRMPAGRSREGTPGTGRNRSAKTSSTITSAPVGFGLGSGVFAVTTSPVQRAVTTWMICGSRGSALARRSGATRKVTITYALSRIAIARAVPSAATTVLVALASLASRVTLPTLMTVRVASTSRMPITTSSSRSVKARRATRGWWV